MVIGRKPRRGTIPVVRRLGSKPVQLAKEEAMPSRPPPVWALEPVRIAGPDPAWPERAAEFAAELHSLLGRWLRSDVLHVGSTAIPGLAAKPVIDLMATAEDPDAAVASEQDAMAHASWFLVPPELDQRPWRRFVVRTDAAGQRRRAHLHLMWPGEPRWDEQLAFRDRLRAEPALAAEYATLKARAAAEHRADREAYTAAKATFVRRVLDAAY